MRDKQAILITAYKDEPSLVRLIRHFASDSRFRVFVHVDAKSKELSVARLRALGYDNLEVISRYKICWGSIRHIFAVLDLMRLILAHEDISYAHVVSGQDLALHMPDWYMRTFAGDENVHACHGDMRMKDRNKEDWYCRYTLPSFFCDRNRVVALINRVLISLQKMFHIRRNRFGEILWDDLRFTMMWASYPIDACRIIVSFADSNRAFLHALNFTRVPEEAFFGTALVGTRYQHKNGVERMRYEDWSNRRGARPAVLDESDFNAMYEENYAFARKVDSVVSEKLITLVSQHIKEECC